MWNVNVQMKKFKPIIFQLPEHTKYEHAVTADTYKNAIKQSQQQTNTNLHRPLLINIPRTTTSTSTTIPIILTVTAVAVVVTVVVALVVKNQKWHWKAYHSLNWLQQEWSQENRRRKHVQHWRDSVVVTATYSPCNVGRNSSLVVCRARCPA